MRANEEPSKFRGNPPLRFRRRVKELVGLCNRSYHHRPHGDHGHQKHDGVYAETHETHFTQCATRRFVPRLQLPARAPRSLCKRAQKKSTVSAPAAAWCLCACRGSVPRQASPMLLRAQHKRASQAPATGYALQSSTRHVVLCICAADMSTPQHPFLRRDPARDHHDHSPRNSCSPTIFVIKGVVWRHMIKPRVTQEQQAWHLCDRPTPAAWLVHEDENEAFDAPLAPLVLQALRLLA